jgi:hypothetical protein
MTQLAIFNRRPLADYLVVRSPYWKTAHALR